MSATVPLMLMVDPEAISRHRGYVVHQALGDDRWAVSAACGLAFRYFPTRGDAELAVRKLAEVLDLDTWPTDYAEALRRWDRTPKATKDQILAVCAEFGGSRA